MPPMPPAGYTPYAAAAAAGNYATFGARLGAFVIDGLIGAIFSIPAVVIFLAGPRHYVECTINGNVDLCHLPTRGTVGLAILVGIVGWLLFMVLYCKKVAAGQSWGQKATGVRVVDATTGQSISAGKVFGRQVCRVFSQAVCLLGYFWMLWDARKQTWHDKMLNTVVVKA
jgi:uncharacterized RDD family membrane protein YckC